MADLPPAHPKQKTIIEIKNRQQRFIVTLIKQKPCQAEDEGAVSRV
jgi:hypothetical protein